METQERASSVKKDSNKIYLLLIVVLALFTTNAILFFRNQKSQEQVVKLSDEKVLMQKELDKVEAELDKVNNDYTLLNEQLQQKQEEARQKINELREALRQQELTKRELASAQAEVKELRDFVNTYLAEIEELNKQNSGLIVERDSLKTAYQAENDRASNLEKQNKELDKKVRAAAALKIAYTKINPIRIRANGKASNTSRASNAQQLRISFKLQNNEFAELGLHQVYLRILDPKGNLVLTEGGKMSLISGEELEYSSKSAIDFVNDQTKIYTILWANKGPFSKGSYDVVLYADGFTIGSGKVSLK
ncbi:MAG: hypothetical protein RI924_1419 [Bacteroidota bacterium]|jgi:predicted  nucleic acid-binding Zn-ribbon protein